MVWLLAAAPAQATRNISIASVAVPPPMTVGEQGSRDIKMTNISDAMETYTPNPVWIQPSCGSAPDPCANPDVGVFSVASVTGVDGVCNGDSFTVTHDDTRDLGAFKIIPVTPRAMQPNPPVNPPEFCTYRFTFDVLRLPTVDSDPGTAGLQTTQRIFVSPAEHPSTVQSVTVGDVTVNPCTTNCPPTPPTPPTNPPVTTPPAAIPAAGPTGLRAAALKKCKKKHGRARSKCKKRANLLPV
jgi:hypothetical protein